MSNLFEMFDPSTIIEESASCRGIFQMKILPDGIESYLSGAVVTEFGSMTYIAEIQYRLEYRDEDLKDVISFNPRVISERFLLDIKSHGILYKVCRVSELRRKIGQEIVRSTCGRTEKANSFTSFANQLEANSFLNDVYNAKNNFISKDNNIVNYAIDKYKL